MRKKRILYLTSFLISLLFTMVYQHPAFAVDSAATPQDLQNNFDTVMHARQTAYTVNYSGDVLTIKTDIAKVLNNVLNADDYLKYTTKGYSYTYSGVSGAVTINLSFNYWNTAQMDSYVNTKVTDILSTLITPGMNDYEKEKVIHDWIEKNVAYDTSLVKHSDYDALVSPFKTVCQGYALLAYKMLNQAGIQTKIIDGVAGGQAHAWNLVYLDGAWYQLDTTWDDPVPDVPGRVTYNYYNLTDSQIKTNHTWTKTYPAATTLFGDVVNQKITSDPTAAVYNDLYNALDLQYMTPAYTVNSTAELAAKIQTAINNGQSSIYVRYMNGGTITTDIANVMKSITNITGYSYSRYSFLRSPETSDVILNLSFTYITPINVSSLTFTPETLSLMVGGATGTIVPSILPSNATNKNIIWTSSDPKVATVTNGIVKAIAGGTAIITGTSADGGYQDTCIVNVTQKVSGITFDKKTVYLKVGDPDLTLNAIVNPLTATDKRITWSSSNPNVATVDANGLVHAVTPGTITVKVTSVQDPTKVGYCTVIVPVLVTGVKISPTYTLKMGYSGYVAPVFSPSNATIKTVTWTSSDTSIIKVGATGILTPVASGTATITATTVDGGFTASCTVTVVYPVTSVTLDKTSTYLKVGDPDLTINATVNPASATDKSVIWSSSNPNVATVDANGVVHAVTPGTVTIKAVSVQDPTKVGYCKVIVPVLVTGITINSTYTLKMGYSGYVAPVISPSTATIKTVTWTSSDTSIVKVSATGILTPVAPGTATLTATTTDGGFTASCTVTVVYPVTSITLDKTSTYLKVGAPDLTLNATVNPTAATNKSVTWSSSNSNIATVDAYGNVHAVAPGTVVIKVKSVQDPTKVASCTIVVQL